MASARQCFMPNATMQVLTHNNVYNFHFTPQIACGEDFSVALDREGLLYTTGSSEFGQLGNGETGQYFVTASKLAFANCSVWTPRTNFCHAPGEKMHGSGDKTSKVVPLPDQANIRLQQIACGKHHTLALEADSDGASPRLWSWGCGDYGVLGHGIQADEYFPRLVGSLQQLPMVGASRTAISAGQHCSEYCWWWWWCDHCAFWWWLD